LSRKNGLGRPVVAGAVGVGIGLVLGNRLVKTYDWRTEWLIPAPLLRKAGGNPPGVMHLTTGLSLRL
jgi:hypothetical protein